MNLKKKLRVTKPLATIINLVAIIIISVVFQGCEKEYLTSERTYSDEEYYSMLKNKVDMETSKKENLETSFMLRHGLPLWEQAYWYEINERRMLVVPILSTSSIKKSIIGLIDDNGITPFITETSPNQDVAQKVYGLNNRELFNSKTDYYSHPRLKSGEVESQDVQNLLSGGSGSAQDLFDAANSGASYNPNATLGVIRLCTNHGGGSSIYSTSGHSWIEIEINGTIMTFSLWGNMGEQEYWVNNELGATSTASMSSPLTYSGFQSILNWNSDSTNVDWRYNNTCAGYSTDVWNQVTGDSLYFGSITTPTELYNYMK